MPHSTASTLTTDGKRACPYCGRPIRRDYLTCGYCRDLPALEPLDDRYTLRKDGES